MSEKQLKKSLHTVIFGTDTPAGKLFDVILIWAILVSVAALMLDSMGHVKERYGTALRALEWFFTWVFTVEYLVRVYCSPRRLSYIRSFYGIVDLLSVLPTYLSLFVGGANYLLVVRLIRVLRIFRVLKLARYLEEVNVLARSLLAAQRKISVFFIAVLVMATVFGSIMYVVEGPANGFTSIPKSVYWTIVTITTVGYGDITPQTVIGQIVATAAMLTGYSIIAVPTGIVTAELTQEMNRERQRSRCTSCEATGHDRDANWCKHCGGQIELQPVNKPKLDKMPPGG